MTRSRKVVRAIARGALATALVATAAVVGATVSPSGDSSVQAVGEALGAGGEYHPIATPVRIFDSRNRTLDSAPFGKKPIATNVSGSTFEVQVVGKGGLPAPSDTNRDGQDDRVLAVAVNITVIEPDQPGFLRAFGKGAPEGDTALVNYGPGQYIPNNAILRPGADGKLVIRLVGARPGAAHVTVDLFGWFSTSTYGTNGARLIPAGPGRIYDSRVAKFGARPVRANQVVGVPIRGASSFDPVINGIVPNDANVVGVMVNLSGVNNIAGSKPTFVSALPASPRGKVPTTSNLNLVPGQVRSNLSIVPVGPDGAIYLYNLSGNVHLVVDVVGYLVKGRDPATAKGRVVPLVAPFRVFDTRDPAFGDYPLAPGKAEDWSFQEFVEDVKIGTEPVGPQLGLIGNMAATGLQRQYPWAPIASYLTAYPTPSSTTAKPPTVANLTIVEGETVPNMTMLQYGSNADGPYQVRFYNLAGWVDYIVDASAIILDD